MSTLKSILACAALVLSPMAAYAVPHEQPHGPTDPKWQAVADTHPECKGAPVYEIYFTDVQNLAADPYSLPQTCFIVAPSFDMDDHPQWLDATSLIVDLHPTTSSRGGDRMVYMHMDQHMTMVNNNYLVIPDGTFSYTAVSGEQMTVPSFKVLDTSPVQPPF